MRFWSEKQILCVDDVVDDCELFRLFLAEAGFTIEAAQSFTDAVQLIENNQFDLYLFDISLPDGTGFELLEKVQNKDPLAPVVICTADVRASTRQQAMHAGAQAFFTKPIDYDLLVKTIVQLLPLAYAQ